MVLQRPHEAGPSCIDGVEQQIGVVRDEARALDARVSSHYIIISAEGPLGDAHGRPDSVSYTHLTQPTNREV